MVRRITKKRLAYFLLIVLAFIGIYLWGNRIDANAIAITVKKAGPWGPIVYVLLLSSTFVFAPLSGTPFFFAGYLLFGRNVQPLSYVAAVLAGVINFWIGRKWGRRIVVKLVGGKNMAKVDEFTKDYGVRTLIFLRIFLGQFHDFISYAFGLTKIKFLYYLLVSVLAPLPYLFFWQLYVVPKVENLRDLAIWQFGTLIPILVISGFLYAKFRKKNQKIPNP